METFEPCLPTTRENTTGQIASSFLLFSIYCKTFCICAFYKTWYLRHIHNRKYNESCLGRLTLRDVVENLYIFLLFKQVITTTIGLQNPQIKNINTNTRLGFNSCVLLRIFIIVFWLSDIYIICIIFTLEHVKTR